MKQAVAHCRTAMMKIMLTLMGCFVLFGGMGRNVYAEEAASDGERNIIQASLMVTSVQSLGLEMPSADAAVVVELPAGTQIMVTGQQDGWYEAFYQGKTIYIAENELATSTSIDQAALDEELKNAAEKDAAYIESLEMQRKAIKRAAIWRGVIIFLIIAVFATGVVSSVKKNRIVKKGKGGSR